MVNEVTLAERRVATQQEYDDRLRQRMNAGVFGKITADQRLGGGGTYRQLFAWYYDGEKNSGELGPPKEYRIDHRTLAMRSWQAFIESELAQTILGKNNTWVIGTGLKLQSEPAKDVLEMEGISMKDSNKFSKAVEARFNIYANSRRSDYTGMDNLNILQSVAYKHAIVGGDCLVILRFNGKAVTTQLIDGIHIISPQFGTSWYPQALANGNRIEDGIELNGNNEHVAYYVRVFEAPGFNFKTVRIAAKLPNGTLTAFLVYGSKYRIDSQRGMPLLNVVFETLKKLERYKEATVGSAEERQKIAYIITHEIASTGENPLLRQTAVARDIGGNSGDVPVTVQGEILSNRVAATTNKQAYNMPQGADMKALASKSELYFRDFYEVNIDIICAAVEIPPDVAMSKYNNSYSASRAAIKDWEHTLDVKRGKFGFHFMQPIYNFWLDMEVLRGSITATGYLQARIADNWMAVESYQKARFAGASVPHIDPEKEVNAQRLMLGPAGDHIPLTTAEAATAALNGGDSEANRSQFSAELDDAKRLGIKLPEPVPALPPSSGGKKPKPKKKP